MLFFFLGVSDNTTLSDDSGFIQSLQAVKIKEQEDVTAHGHQDPLEKEFINVVKPVMDTCSKEAIAVSL